MPTYLPRLADAQLLAMLEELPAVAINGPKGVGKTATAERLAKTTVHLDVPAERERTEADLLRLRTLKTPVLLDEWQRLPQIWDETRRWVDAGTPNGSIILTGSAAPINASIHSGAGRISTLRMRPLSLSERTPAESTVSLSELLAGDARIEGATTTGLSDYAHEITASGFPGVRRLSAPGRARQLDSYIEYVIQKEFPQQGQAIRAPETLHRWLRAYAAAGATVASYAKILDAATPGETNKPAKTTTIGYRDVLASLWLLDPVEPWSPGAIDLGRLGQSPKHFLADPALACRLLEIEASDLLDGVLDRDPLLEKLGTGFGTVFGRFFEALVGLSLQTYTTSIGARLGHLRTRNGDHEIDFIAYRGRRAVAFEVKLSATVSDGDVRHLRWLRDRMGPHLTDAAIITTGAEAYRRTDGIAVVPAAMLDA